MSFASGLFSFLGGASQQFREEIDLANVRKAKEAAAAAERQEKLLAFQEEQRKHNEIMALNRDKFALEKEVQAFNEYKFKLDNQFRYDEVNIKKEQWHDDYKLKLKNHDLKVKEINANIANANTVEERKQLELELEKEIFNHEKDLDALQLKFNYDELAENTYLRKLEIENQIKKSKSGAKTYGGGFTFNFKDYATEKERHRAFLSAVNNFYTPEILETMSNVERLELKNDIDYNLGLYLDSIAMKTQGNEGKFRDISGGYNIDNAIDVYTILGGNFKKDIKDRAQNSLKNNGVENIDDIKTKSEVHTQGDVSEAIINNEPVNFKYEAQRAGFETADQFLSAIDSIISVANKVQQKNKTFGLLQPDLNPFEDRMTFLSALDSSGLVNETTGYNIVKLAPFFNKVQEARYSEVSYSINYDEFVREALEQGVLTVDKYGNIKGEEKLVMFAHMIMPRTEFSKYQEGSDFIAGSNLPEVYGQGARFVQKDMESQNSAANQVLITTQNIRNLILEGDKTDEDLIGATLNVANLGYKFTKQFRGLAKLWSGGFSVKHDFRLRIGDGTSDPITGGISEAKLKEITDGIDNAANILERLEGKVGEGVGARAARKNAQLTMLKFTLAYQMSMALQGGSGGRTISDQDVDNILKGLQLPDTFFAGTTAVGVLGALATVDEFIEGVELKTRFVGQGNTMRNIRTHDFTVQLLRAASKIGGVDQSSLGFYETMQERHNIGAKTEKDDASLFDSTMYNKANGWSIRLGNVGNQKTPIYVDLNSAGVPIAQSARYIPLEILNDMASKVSEIDGTKYNVVDFNENQKPEFGGQPVFKVLGKE